MELSGGTARPKISDIPIPNNNVEEEEDPKVPILLRRNLEEQAVITSL